MVGVFMGGHFVQPIPDMRPGCQQGNLSLTTRPGRGGPGEPVHAAYPGLKPQRQTLGTMGYEAGMVLLYRSKASKPFRYLPE